MKNKMPGIRMEVTLDNMRINKEGKAWFHFVAPLTEGHNALACVTIDVQQCLLFAKVAGEEYHMATVHYNGIKQQPPATGGAFLVPFTSDFNSVNYEEMAELVQHIGAFPLSIAVAYKSNNYQQILKLVKAIADSTEEPRSFKLAVITRTDYDKLVEQQEAEEAKEAASAQV